MNQTKQILIAARGLIDTPEKWGKGWYAFDAEGGLVSAVSPYAQRRCMAGALCAVSGCDFGDPILWPAVNLLESQNGIKGNCCLADFNDDPERTHAEVMEAFDKAIANCGEE